MKKRKGEASFLHIGSSSLLVIFVILCLVTFAALALASAQRDYAFSSRMAQRKAAYYQASNAAEERLASIDEALSQGTPVKAEDLSYQIPIGERQALSVVLTTDAGSDTFYQIKSWQIINTVDWKDDEPLPLLPIPQ